MIQVDTAVTAVSGSNNIAQSSTSASEGHHSTCSPQQEQDPATAATGYWQDIQVLCLLN